VWLEWTTDRKPKQQVIQVMNNTLSRSYQHSFNITCNWISPTIKPTFTDTWLTRNYRPLSEFSIYINWIIGVIWECHGDQSLIDTGEKWLVIITMVIYHYWLYCNYLNNFHFPFIMLMFNKGVESYFVRNSDKIYRTKDIIEQKKFL
jgi:hypothetical protein